MKKQFLGFITISALLCTSYSALALTEVKSEAEFNQIIQKESKILVDFFSPTCPPCSRMATFLSDIEKDYSSVKFIKVNVVSLGSLANKYGISSIPVIAFFKDHKEVSGSRVIGYKPQQVKEGLNKIK